METQEDIQAAVTIQSHVRGWLIRRRLHDFGKEETGMLRIRASAYCELLRAERKFIDSLETIQNVYITPIQNNALKYNLGETAVKYLLGNIKSLYEFHKDFNEKLEIVRCHRLYPVVLTLGEVMNEESANLRAVHMSYANNFVSCIETLRYLQSTVSRFQTLITVSSF